MVIGIGIDIQEIRSIEAAIERTGERFVEKTYTIGEQDYCRKHKNPGQHYTARFCAKEALFKALGTGWSGGIKWQEVEVVHEAFGQPALRISGQAQTYCRQAGVKSIWLSLSHSQAYAVAMVVLEGDRS